MGLKKEMGQKVGGFGRTDKQLMTRKKRRLKNQAILIQIIIQVSHPHARHQN